MEWMDRGHLQERLQALRGQALPAAQAVAIIATVARAVHHAHENGVLHRDLTPRNILFDSNDSPHVSDFGLAKWFNEDSELTRTGQGLGTPGFPSPEQALGRLDQLTPASDVFSLGAIFYQLLTGRPAFPTANWLEFLKAVADQDPIPPRSLDPRLDRDLATICLKCLDKIPARRYGSAGALAEELHRWQAGLPIQARPASRWDLSLKWARRHPAAVALLALIGLSLAIGAGGTFWQQRRARLTHTELLKTVPLQRAEILRHIEQHAFEPALLAASNLRRLLPDEPDLIELTANLQQSLHRYADAAAGYQALLALSPEYPFARTNLALCGRLASLPATAPDPKPRQMALSELHQVMQAQQRHAEAIALAQHLGARSARQLDAWRNQLLEAGLAPDRVGRLLMNDQGLLELDLANTDLIDLEALRGLPFGKLILSRTKITDITPLRGMPLTFLNLDFVSVADWSPLQTLPLRTLQLYGTKISDLRPLANVIVASRLPVRLRWESPRNSAVTAKLVNRLSAASSVDNFGGIARKCSEPSWLAERSSVVRPSSPAGKARSLSRLCAKSSWVKRRRPGGKTSLSNRLEAMSRACRLVSPTGTVSRRSRPPATAMVCKLGAERGNVS